MHGEYLFTSYTVYLAMLQCVQTRQGYMYKQSEEGTAVIHVMHLGCATFEQLVVLLNDAHFVQEVQVGEFRWGANWIFLTSKHVWRNVVIYKT